VQFDPYSEAFFEDPSEVYRWLRREAPVYHNETYGFWALSRAERQSLNVAGARAHVLVDLYGSVDAGLTSGTEASKLGLAYIRGALASATA